MAKAKGITVRVTLQGDKQLERLLRELPSRVAKRALRQAVNAGAMPIVKATRTSAKGIKKSGLMAKAVNKKVKLYPSGVAIALVGANSAVRGEFKGKNRVPANYWHLVLGGTRPHAIGKGSRLKRKSRPNSQESQSGRMHPGTKANNILEAAVNATRATSRKRMEAKMIEAVTKEAAKLAAKAKK